MTPLSAALGGAAEREKIFNTEFSLVPVYTYMHIHMYVGACTQIHTCTPASGGQVERKEWNTSKYSKYTMRVRETI